MESVGSEVRKGEVGGASIMFYDEEILNTASGVDEDIAALLKGRINGHSNGKENGKAASRILRATFPIHEVLVDMHVALGEFIHDGLRPHQAMGFLNTGYQPLDVKPLVSSTWSAIHKLEKIYKSSSASDPISLMNRAMAVNTIAPLKYFLLGLNSIQYQDGLGKSDASSVIHQSIELEQLMAGQILEIEQVKMKIMGQMD